MTSLPMTAGLPWGARVAKTMRHNNAEMWRHFARRWYVYAVLLIAGAVLSRYIGVNFTDSMPERLVWLERGVVPARGDLVVFNFEGRGIASKFNDSKWFKRVLGVPGDAVTVVGREVFVNGVSAGRVAERTPRGVQLFPLEAGTIPAGHYYLGGTSLDSFDSRYSLIGLVRSERVQARAHKIF